MFLLALRVGGGRSTLFATSPTWAAVALVTAAAVGSIVGVLVALRLGRRTDPTPKHPDGADHDAKAE